MAPIELTGYWFLPDQPDKEVAGTLRLTKEKGLRLSLTGSFSPSDWGSFEGRQYETIFGVLEKSNYGKFVTLLESFRTRLATSMPGFATEEIHVHTALVGHYHLRPDELVFKGFRLRLARLDDWFNISHLEQTFELEEGRPSGVTVTYRRPPKTTVRFGHKELAIRPALAIESHGRSITVSDIPYLIMENLGDFDLRSIMHTHVRYLQNLVMLATDSPNPVSELLMLHSRLDAHADLPGEPAQFAVIRHQIMDPSETESAGRRRDMLFTYSDAIASGIPYFEKWFSFNAQYERFCEVFFGHILAPLTHLEDKFSRILSEFDLFFRTRGAIIPQALEAERILLASSSCLDSLSKELWLRKMLPDKFALSLPWALYESLQRYSAIMDPMVKGQPEQFISHVLVTRQYLACRDDDRYPEAAKREQLYDLNEKLRFLMILCMLDAVGFPADWIQQMIRKNSHYTYLCTKPQTWPPAPSSA